MNPTHEEGELLTRRHALFAFRSLKFLPTPYQAEDSNRVTFAYFCLSALALIPGSAVSSSSSPNDSALDALLKKHQQAAYCDWVYQHQAVSGGFRGSDSLAGTARADGDGEGESHATAPGFSAVPLKPDEEKEFAELMAFEDSSSEHGAAPVPPPLTGESPYEPPTLIHTYTALLLLSLFSDDLKRVDRHSLLRFVARCQTGDGSFLLFPGCLEPPDVRSSYAAFVISSILGSTVFDVDSAVRFLHSCFRPEGGYSTSPGLEPHGGSTYCVIASFSIASRLPELVDSGTTLRWLVSRQTRPPHREALVSSDEDEEGSELALPQVVAGFQGRPGKDTDACYSFWCTASIKLLRPGLDLLRPELDRSWLQSCQHFKYGGIAREPGASPDVYHTYLALAALSLGDHPDLRLLDAEWNVAVDVRRRTEETVKRLATAT